MLFFFIIDFELFGPRSFLQLCENVAQPPSVDYALCDTEIRVNTLCADKPKNSIYLTSKTFYYFDILCTVVTIYIHFFNSVFLHFELFIERNSQVFDMETVVLKSNIIKTSDMKLTNRSAEEKTVATGPSFLFLDKNCCFYFIFIIRAIKNQSQVIKINDRHARTQFLLNVFSWAQML